MGSKAKLTVLTKFLTFDFYRGGIPEKKETPTMKKSILITMTLLGIVGIAGITRSFSGQPQRAVALMPQHPVTGMDSSTPKSMTMAADSPADSDTEVQDDQVPQALKDVGEYAESIYDMAKVADWPKAQANLATLQQSVRLLEQQTPNRGSGIDQLMGSIDPLSQAIATQDQQATQRLANQVTLLAAQLTQQYQTKVPVEITLLDYYGRQLEVDAASGNLVQLQATAHQITQTWQAVRPAVVRHGGTAQAQPFDALVAQANQAKTVSDYGQLATPILNQVDQLEAVFR